MTEGAVTAAALWLNRDTIAIPEALGGVDWQFPDTPGVVLRPRKMTQADRDANWLLNAEPYRVFAVEDQDGQPLDGQELQDLLQGDLTLQAGTLRTGIQIPGILDDVYGGAVNQALGLTWHEGVPTLKLWAPTAHTVVLQLQGDPIPATRDDDGVWTVVGNPDWEDTEYLWQVTVYSPSAGEVVTNLVPDPYSVALTVDSKRSVMTDLADPRWMPPGWPVPAPELRTPAQQTIYELHVRDFSIFDQTVPADLRGTYAAFTLEGSHGTNALRELAQAGLTTVHLLPTYDIASSEIPEERDKQKIPAVQGTDLTWENRDRIVQELGPASPLPQEAVEQVVNQDGFNWGYEPFLWGTPEGSYASAGNQHGGRRTLEYRQMVMALHEMGLQVVQDVVFNHTTGVGQGSMSVLDKVVPGYYHRLDARGALTTSTCCANIATEHALAEKLMVDMLVLQATQYGIDGFRFDLMGHHSLQNMIAARDALGPGVYLYGEGWEFGEVAGDARFIQATQKHLAGTGIGAFNDRIRDGVRGGGPADNDQRATQGFATGQYWQPNPTAGQMRTSGQQRADLEANMDLIRAGLVANLKDYVLPTRDGAVALADLDYHGQGAGFADQPAECVNYVEAHDNETLYDNGVWKLPEGTSIQQRLRLHVLANATVALSQGACFWASGTELLRSKSLDRDSFNSGDWFNGIDWTGQWNQFGTGLPRAVKNQGAWPLMTPLLQNADLRPTPPVMAQAKAMHLDLLRLRASTPLFTLGDAQQVMDKVSFPCSGDQAVPGVIVILIDDLAGPVKADPDLDAVLVVFNAQPQPWCSALRGLAGRKFELSPVQQSGSDPAVREAVWDFVTGTVEVPAHTVAVFVEPAART